MNLVMVETDQIRPYEQNPRRNEATIAKLVELIPRTGFNVPLVLDHANVIVKGHSRWEAAKRLGMPRLPCIYTDADEDTIRLDRLADNKVQEFSSWDADMLKSELASLSLDYSFDLGALNFKLEDRPFRTSATLDTGPAPVTAANGGGPAPAADGKPFITEADIAGTVTQPQHQYGQVTCPKCGQPMLVRQ